METDLCRVRLDRINLPAELPRVAYSAAGYRRLKASVKLHGILVPLILRRAGGGEYFVVDGATRVRIAQELGRPGRTEIPALVLKADDGQAIAAGIAINQVRERLSTLAELRALRNLVDQGLSQKDAARALGKTKSWATKMLGIDALPARVRAHVEAGRVPVAHAIVIARYVGQPRIVEMLLAESIKGQTSARFLRRLAEEAAGRGVAAARRRRPRSVSLTKDSWVRLEPVRGGTRAELHLSDADDPAALARRLAALLAEVRPKT